MKKEEVTMLKFVKYGFVGFSSLSLILYAAIMIVVKVKAESLAMKDLFHVMTVFIFNEIMETMIAPSFPDIFFLIPVTITDGMIGAFIGVLCAPFLQDINGKKIYSFILTSSFILYQIIIFYFVPPFIP
jgi:hypothetical protein